MANRIRVALVVLTGLLQLCGSAVMTSAQERNPVSGRGLVLIEFRGEDPNVPILALHKMTVAQVRQELAADGFDIERVIDVLPWQHIVVLKKRS